MCILFLQTLILCQKNVVKPAKVQGIILDHLLNSRAIFGKTAVIAKAFKSDCSTNIYRARPWHTMMIHNQNGCDPVTSEECVY